MNDHVVEYQQSGHPEGMIAVLAPHPHRPDWEQDGHTCYPNMPCVAISATSNARCGKREAVVRLLARTKYARVGSAEHELNLCGGHFNSHRAGREVRVIVTPAKAL